MDKTNTMKITKLGIREKKATERRMTIDEVVELVRSEKTKEKIEKFRKSMLTMSLKRREKAVSKLDKLLFAVEQRDNKMLAYNGLVLLDVNHLSDNQEAAEVKARLMGYPQTMFAMIGASGKSVKFIVPYTLPDGTLPTTPEKAELFHAHAYRHAIETYDPRLSHPIEIRERLLDAYCRLSYDKEVYYNADAMPIHIDQPTAMPEDKAKGESDITLRKTLADRFRELSMQFELAWTHAVDEYAMQANKEDYKPLLTVLAQDCFKIGVEEEDCTVWALLRLCQVMSEAEIRSTIHNVYLTSKGFGVGELYNEEQLKAYKLDDFMHRRYDLRYNTMRDMVEYRKRNTFCFEFQPVTKRDLFSIALQARMEGIDATFNEIRGYIYSDCAAAYSPIEDWLSQLPKWDGKTDHIGALARRVPCDNPKWEYLFRVWFLSMVAQWKGLDDRYGNCLSPLLIGGQATGKSTFCRHIIPDKLRKAFYTDDIDFSKASRAALYLTRFALINIDEFDQVSNKHQGFLKHLLQKSSVNMIKPHGAVVENIRRYASFIATSNHSDLLSDPSGSRRFICIKVTDEIDNNTPIDYDQLYAQALELINRGERYYLTYEESMQLTESNLEFQQTSAAEELFSKYFRPASSKATGTRLTATEIFLEIKKRSGIKLPQGQIPAFGKFLSNQKIPTTKSGGMKHYHVIEK